MRVKSKKIFAAIRQYASFIIFGINLLTITLMLCSFLAWSVSPAKIPLFAYIGLGFPIVLVINSLFIVFWLILTKWKFALTGVVALVICWGPISSYFPINLRSKEIPEDSFKFLSYNVRGFTHEWRGNAVNNRVIKYVNETDADIVCMQEFTYYGPTGEKMDDKFKERFPKYPYYTIINFRPYLSGVTYGAVCISKFPIVKTTQIPVDADGNGSALVTLNIKGKNVALVMNHLQSNKITAEDKQLYKDFLKDTRSESLDSVARNITSRLGAAYKERAQQVDIIANMLANEQSDAVIVCGDFNDPPISYSYKKLRDGLTDSFKESGFGMGITYNEKLFWFRIDYIFHSKNMESYNCTVDKVKYSDHYPLWTYLRFKD